MEDETRPDPVRAIGCAFFFRAPFFRLGIPGKPKEAPATVLFRGGGGEGRGVPKRKAAIFGSRFPHFVIYPFAHVPECYLTGSRG